MIHSLSGGVIHPNDHLLYAQVQLTCATGEVQNRWFICPFRAAVGDRALVSLSGGMVEGVILRLENVTKQTAPFPVNRTAEIIKIIKPTARG